MSPLHCHSRYPGLLVLLLSASVCVWGGTITVPSDQAKSISKAFSLCRQGDTVLVQPGTYREHVTVPTGVSLVAVSLLKSTIQGKGHGTVVALSNHSSIQGFQVKGGTIGIYSKNAGNSIRKCRVVEVSQTGIMCLGQLPLIEDNIVAFNRGSGIQGWDVRSTSASISHNTIAYNENHGVSLGGLSSVVLDNNIIAGNKLFGIKVDSPNVKVQMRRNNLFGNSTETNAPPGDNVTVDPQFVVPHKLNFSLQEGSQCIGAGSDNSNLGARIELTE